MPSSRKDHSMKPSSYTYKSLLPYAATMAAGLFGKRVFSGPGKKRAYKPVGHRPSVKKFSKKRVRRAVMNRCVFNKQLYELKKKMNHAKGLLKLRGRFAVNLACPARFQAGVALQDMSTLQVEEPMQQLRVFNPAAVGTYQIIDFTTGLQMKEVEVTLFRSIVRARNNFNVPINITIYCCIPKTDCSISPFSAYVGGLSQVSDGSLDATTPMYKPWDSPQFRDLWTIVVTTKRFLQPGQEATCEYRGKTPFNYDPSFVDSNPLLYQGRYAGHAYMAFMDGPLCHDGITGATSSSQCRVDFMQERHVNIRYEAGADIEYCIVNTALPTLPNSSIVGLPNNATGEIFSLTL